MNLHNAIGAKSLETGEVSIHCDADPGGAYQTLCGLSIDGDLYEFHPISNRSRVNCPQCFSVWKEARRFRAEDFYVKGG